MPVFTAAIAGLASEPSPTAWPFTATLVTLAVIGGNGLEVAPVATLLTTASGTTVVPPRAVTTALAANFLFTSVEALALLVIFLASG